MESAGKSKEYYTEVDHLPAEKGPPEMSKMRRKKVFFASALLVVLSISIMVIAAAFGLSIRKYKRSNIAINRSSRRGNESGFQEYAEKVAQKEQVRYYFSVTHLHR